MNHRRGSPSPRRSVVVLTDHSIAKGMRYLDRMPTELRVLAMRDAAARNRAITHTPEFVRFGVEHAEVLQ